MALNASNVRVAVTGGIYRGPSGTTTPTDATTTLDGALVEQGYASDAGISQTIAADTTQIKAWQNGDTVRTVQSSHDVTFKFEFLETNPETLKAFYGNYSGAGTELKAVQGEHNAWVLHVVDGTSKIRIVIPDGQITERGDVSYVTGDAIKYPVTLSCYPDGAGVKAYIYLADGSVTSLTMAATLAVTTSTIKKLTALAAPGNVDVSALAAWSSSDPTKATVAPGGFVTGVVGGSTTVTATYAGKTATSTVTVS